MPDGLSLNCTRPDSPTTVCVVHDGRLQQIPRKGPCGTFAEFVVHAGEDEWPVCHWHAGALLDHLLNRKGVR